MASDWSVHYTGPDLRNARIVLSSMPPLVALGDLIPPSGHEDLALSSHSRQRHSVYDGPATLRKVQA